MFLHTKFILNKKGTSWYTLTCDVQCTLPNLLSYTMMAFALNKYQLTLMKLQRLYLSNHEGKCIEASKEANSNTDKEHEA